MANEALINVQKEKEIVKQMISLVNTFQISSEKEKELMRPTVKALFSQLKLLADSVDGMIKIKEVPVPRTYQRIETSSDLFL